MPVRRLNRTAQLALAAAVAWAAVVLSFVVLLLLGQTDFSLDDWSDNVSEAPALIFVGAVPLVALGLSTLLGLRLLRREEGPRDRGFAIALLGPGIAWIALAVFKYLF